MALVNLLSLPIEVLEKVSDELEDRDRRACRLACARLNDAFEARVFYELNLRVHHDWQMSSDLALLQTLASSQNKISKYVRNLRILRLSPSPPRTGTYMGVTDDHSVINALLVVQNCLGPAVRSLKQLQSVHWSFVADELSWIKETILSALSSLANLKDFSLFTDQDPQSLQSFPLYQLAPLRQLRIDIPTALVKHIWNPLRELLQHCPQLARLSLFCYRPRDQWEIHFVPPQAGLLLENIQLPSLSYLCLEGWTYGTISKSKVNMFSLTTLHVGSVSYQDDSSDIWKMVLFSGIRLQDVSSFGLSESLIEYLASYQGLHRLSLQWRHVICSTDSISRVYQVVLPNHAETLVDLCIRSRDDIRWGVGEQFVGGISCCERLQKLGVTLSVMDVTETQDSTTSLLNGIGGMSSLRSLEIFSVIHGTWYTGGPHACRTAILDFSTACDSTFSGGLTVLFGEEVYQLPGNHSDSASSAQTAGCRIRKFIRLNDQ